MKELEESIAVALESRAAISRKLVRAWIQQADGVEIDALLYRFTREAWDRVEPRLELKETCALIQRYFFRCIREDPQDGAALSRYDAAGQLETWFDHLAGMNEAREIVQSLVDSVAELFLSSDDETRRAIETGFLEHVLEQRALRHYFAHWAHDERLQDAWRHALAWGEAHPNLMKGLRAQLRAVQGDDE